MFGLFRKKIAWETSEKGNPTAFENDWRVTVFPATNPKGFAFVVGYDKDEPFFSKRFKSQDEAQSAAEEIFLAAISGNATKFERLCQKHEEG